MKTESGNPQFQKIRETGEIIQAVIAFLRSEYRQLFRLLAIYILPFIVLYAVNQVSMQLKLAAATQATGGMTPEEMVGRLGSIYPNLLLSVMFNIFVQSLMAALLYTYIKVYLQRGKGSFAGADVSSQLFSHSLRVIGTSFVVTVLAGFGLMFFILPGIIIANSMSLALFITVFENRGIGESISRSWSLVRRQWWGTLTLNLLGILIVWMISITLTLPGAIQDAFAGTTPDYAAGAASIPKWRLLMLGTAMTGGSLGSVFPFLFLAFQYFNLTEREAKELNS